MEALSLAYNRAVIRDYYDLNDEAMVIIVPKDNFSIELPFPQKATYALQYIHALQDQHFDLDALWEGIDESSSFDQRLSLSALIKGDAELASADYAMALWLENQAAFEREMEAAMKARSAYVAKAEPLELPAIFGAVTFFSYQHGQDFVAELRHGIEQDQHNQDFVTAVRLRIEQDWRSVNNAFRNQLPQTSEQIYHPQKYLTREGAIEVNPPDLSALIEEGWQVGYDNSVGEFYLRQHLGTQLLGSYPETLAEGWGGDRLQIFADAANEEMMWVWYQVWDSEKDAEEFSKGYAISSAGAIKRRVTMGSAGAARRPTASPASARRRRASLWRPTGKQPALCWACWTDTPRYSALGDPVPGPQASGSPLNSRSIPAPLPLKVSSYNGWHCRQLT